MKKVQVILPNMIQEEVIENSPGTFPMHIASNSKDICVQNLEAFAIDLAQPGFFFPYFNDMSVYEIFHNCKIYVHQKTHKKYEQFRKPWDNG